MDITYFVYLPFVWLVYNAYCLLLNYHEAIKLKLPFIVVPVSPANPLWLAIQTAFPSIFRFIPLDVISFTRYCRLGWEFRDRYRTHQRLGDAWILVTPNQNWLYVADTAATKDIFSRNRDFGRPGWMLAALDVFGPNISSSEGSDWQRHRKLTATPFNEQNSSSVWEESLRQGNDMLEWWASHTSQGINTTPEDFRTLALHVLAYAGFQKSYPYKSAKHSRSEAKSSYRDSISLILQNAILIMVVPAQLFSVPFASAKWKKIGWAIQEFRQYMLQMIADEKKLIKEGKPGSNNLVSNLVRAAEDSGKTHRESRVMKPLSVDEILGNIFVFNFAGHDTTAISLSYSMLLLVANPEVQDWLSEEIQAVLPSEHWETWDYQKAFPELRRCLAVLLETLRLYNPLPGVPKWTGDSSQTLEIMQRTCVLPPRTLVVPALQTLHTHPRYWGSDSLTWRPSRWIQTQSKPIFNVDVKTRLSSERLLTPIPGTFIAWSEGVRNCPGKKFAQVEFVATMARLFHSHRVTPIPKNGEIMLEAQRRVLDVVKDSNVHLLLQMRNPGSVAVKWTRKEDMAS